MKIVFISGSLEPGRDGVGDYTRRLCGELLRYGHQVNIIALYDRHLRGQVIQEPQLDQEQTIHILRLPIQLSWSDRINKAKAFIEAIDPDWISLQYVPFSFHNKGLPYRIINVLEQLSRGRPLHIMFHELWVGMSVQSSVRHKWLGVAQRYLTRLMLHTLHADVIHTHTTLYKIQLNKLGYQATLLPLFANIPVAGNQTGGSIQANIVQHRIAFVLFGGIHPGAPVDQLVNEIISYSTQKKLTVDLTIIGRIGLEQEIWASAWRSRGLTVSMLGEQSPENISTVLSQSSIGISTTPAALAEKSSAISSMHAHGLPILCVSQPWQPRGMDKMQTATGVFQYAIGNLELFMKDYSNMVLPAISIADIRQQFISSLLSIKPKQAVNTQDTLSV